MLIVLIISYLLCETFVLLEFTASHESSFRELAGLKLTDNDKKLYALIEIEKLMKRNGSSLSLYESMPKLPANAKSIENVLILDELSYDMEDLQATHDIDFQR